MSQQPRLPLWFLVVNWALILAAFAIGTYLGSSRSVHLPDPQRSALELVYHEVLQSYIEQQDEHELLERAIAGMVDGLDDYSRYIPPQKVAAYDESSSGHYQGIGAVMTALEDQVVLHFPFDGSPAEQAGLLPGDVIVAVDGKTLDDAESRQNVHQLVRGEAGTTVALTVRRGERQLQVEVERGDVQRPCVKWTHFVDEAQGLGYLYLSDFHPTAGKQLFDAVRALEKQRELRGLIVDLRFDGGGSLDQCLAIARGFLREGVIATQHRRKGKDEVYEARPKEVKWPDLPLVLLVNEQSASASEVLSGALQDHRRAVVVGVRTHGKGYVNTVYSWTDHDFKLKLTTGSYRTPNGRNIERNHATDGNPADKEKGGILPDVEVAVSHEDNVRLYAALHATEVPDAYREGFQAVAERHDLAVAAPLKPDQDPQLQAALEALRKQLD
jgi:carboxyl-terminal processing protease